MYGGRNSLFQPKYTFLAEQIHFGRIFGFGQNSVFSDSFISVLVFGLKICFGCPLASSLSMSAFLPHELIHPSFDGSRLFKASAYACAPRVSCFGRAAEGEVGVAPSPSRRRFRRFQAEFVAYVKRGFLQGATLYYDTSAIRNGLFEGQKTR